ncbi:MAG TPA: site-specific integrase [Candidatus Merdibacter merdigallinarum]|nr:site-specific integrase [Candidatus Merdibacter merdigallinarum]
MSMQEMTDKQLEAYRKELVRRERSPATIANYIRHCGEFLQFCQDSQDGLEAAPNQEMLLSWKRTLLTAGLRPATINAKLAAVNGFLQFLGRPELCVRQVRRQRRVFRDKDRDLTRGEYLRLVQTARAQGRERLCLAMQTICATGIRVSELRFITVEAVRTGRATVTGKGKCREILLPGALRQKLKRYLKGLGRWPQGGDAGANANRAVKPVFLTAGGQPLDRSNLWREMRTLCKDAGVDPHKVFPHNLRHLFAKTFYTLNKDIAKLADLLGHASIETTRIYIMETGAAHARLLERMHLLL